MQKIFTIYKSRNNYYYRDQPFICGLSIKMSSQNCKKKNIRIIILLYNYGTDKRRKSVCTYGYFGIWLEHDEISREKSMAGYKEGDGLIRVVKVYFM